MSQGEKEKVGEEVKKRSGRVTAIGQMHEYIRL